MPYSTLRYDVAATGVATIALDRPEARNALSDEVLDDLLEAFAAARDDDAVRCVVLASTHEKVFSAGGDLAGALGLALACDLVVAREGATFGTPEINVGVFPFMIMALVYRNVPRKRANELLLL